MSDDEQHRNIPVEAHTARDPMTLLVVVAIVVFGALGIGSALWGGRVFHSADLLLHYAPYRDAAPEHFLPQRPCVSDPVDNVLPASTELHKQALDGHFALWDSYAGGGAPLGSVPNFAALSPLSLPAWVLPPWLAPGYIKLLEILAGAAGTALFLRRLRLTRAAAALGGLLFVSSGFMVLWSNWPQTRTATCIPWVFWAIERFVAKRTVASAVPIALSVAAMLLGGFPAIAGYALYAAVPYLIIRLFATNSTRSATKHTAVGFAFIAAGATLIAFQLFAFATQLAGLNLDRAQTANVRLPFSSLVTAFAPSAYGECGGREYFGPYNQLEVVAFVGAAALVLVGVAILRGTAPGVPRAARSFFISALAVTVTLGWVGHLPLQIAQKFPVFSNNPVFRIRSLFGFLVAVLAAMGFDRLQRMPRPNSRTRGRLEIGGWCIALGMVMALVWRNHSVYRTVVGYRASAFILPLIAGGVAVAVVGIAATRRFATAPNRARIAVLAVLPIIVLVESTTFARGFWPRIERNEFYPTTSVHSFLARNSQNGERYIGTGFTMLPGTNVYYELSTPNGHGFTTPRWMELLKTIDPTVAHTPTFTAFASQLAVERVASPILDRMAVKWVVTDPREPLYGTKDSTPIATSTVALHSSSAVEAPLPNVQLRGIGVTVQTAKALTRPAWLRIDVLDTAKRVIASNRRRVDAEFNSGEFMVAIAGESLAPGRRTVRVSLEGGTGLVQLGAAGSIPAPVLSIVKPADDGLRLRFVGPANVWQRTTALARVRWASRAIESDNTVARLTYLAQHRSPDTIVIEQPESQTDGLGATILRADTTGDQRHIRVAARGSGYVVIADALVDGWHATVDGHSTPLLTADHAMVAVRVPKGIHNLVVTYTPPKQRLGFVVSIATLLALCAILLATRQRKRQTALHVKRDASQR